MSHNHSPKSVVGRHGLTLKFNKFWVVADVCTVPRGKLKTSFILSSIGERPVRALVSTTLGGTLKGSIRKANQQELFYFTHNSEKKT